MLVRLLYVSRAVASAPPDAVQQILRQAKAHNTQAGITGVLCHAEGTYMQVLEGGRGAVNRTYGRICADARHDDVELLCYDEISERRFAGWAMGQVNLARLNPALLLKYSAAATLDPYALSGPAALALFDELLATAAIVCQS